eukprot:354846-Chlamydomonas_euryale.AAC.2
MAAQSGFGGHVLLDQPAALGHALHPVPATRKGAPRATRTRHTQGDATRKRTDDGSDMLTFARGGVAQRPCDRLRKLCRVPTGSPDWCGTFCSSLRGPEDGSTMSNMRFPVSIGLGLGESGDGGGREKGGMASVRPSSVAATALHHGSVARPSAGMLCRLPTFASCRSACHLRCAGLCSRSLWCAALCSHPLWCAALRSLGVLRRAVARRAVPDARPGPHRPGWVRQPGELGWAAALPPAARAAHVRVLEGRQPVAAGSMYCAGESRQRETMC